MTTTDNLDVMVVYSAGVALSASIKDSRSKHPFLLNSKQSNYNLSYAYFLRTCQKYAIRAGFTSSADIIGPGLCKSYWMYQFGTWLKINRLAKAVQVFDKISPTSPVRAAERILLLSDTSVIPFNDPELFETFFDKLLTYTKIAQYTVPTLDLPSNTAQSIRKVVKRLRVLIKTHHFRKDFSAQLILKDRYGSGGNYVFKISHHFVARIRALMLQNPDVHFILQPFLHFDKGFCYKNNRTATDIRLIFHHDVLLQCYIRMAKKDDFRCNEHQGGALEYVLSSDIPDSIHKISKEIVKQINKPDSLYALDFVMSNTKRPYFIEGNTGPGLDWDISKKMNECMSKKLIKAIVKEFSLRLGSEVLTPLINNFKSRMPLYA